MLYYTKKGQSNSRFEFRTIRSLFIVLSSLRLKSDRDSIDPLKHKIN